MRVVHGELSEQPLSSQVLQGVLVDNAATRFELRRTGRVTTLQPQDMGALGSLLNSHPKLETLRVRVYQKYQTVPPPYPLHPLLSFCEKLGGNIPKVSQMWLSGFQIDPNHPKGHIQNEEPFRTCELDAMVARHILKAAAGPLTSLSMQVSSRFRVQELLGRCRLLRSLTMSCIASISSPSSQNCSAFT